MPSSRTKACTIHASSNSRVARCPRFSPRIAALAVRSSTSSTRTLKLVNAPICRAVIVATRPIARPPRKNLQAPRPCAGPRTAHPRQLTLLAARAPSLDCASTVRIVVACRSRSRDSADSPATLPLATRFTAIARTGMPGPELPFTALEQTTQGPMAGADADSPLAVRRCAKQNDFGPREVIAPAGQVSERNANFAPRRFSQPALYRLSFIVNLPDAPIPRSTAGTLARYSERFCHASSSAADSCGTDSAPSHKRSRRSQPRSGRVLYPVI